ncbi:MAG TPA: ATP-dependent DNA helicase RecG [Thermoanaerobaculia bacterium]|nr:ATP-dependent DNA helicase RecG [Thermoanaerobaculia bacterium]
MLLKLSSPLSEIPGVGPARARALSEAGYETVRDLLYHLPFRYEDRRAVHAVSDAAPGGSYTLRGRLASVRRIRTHRRGFSLVRGILSDGTGSIPVVWFNRPYLASQSLEGEEWLLHGEVRESKSGPELLNPSCERPDQAIHGARIAPVYPAAGGIGPALLRRILDTILEKVDLPREVPETLPADLLARRGLPPLGEALQALHAPEEGDPEELNRRRSPAHGRLIYQELLELQLGLALLRERERDEKRTRHYSVDDKLRGVARSVLPFPLTRAQKRALREIVTDLQGPRPMLRLLQGDVGSGKTIVAALALVVALENGYQGAFMAPTQLVAEQHFASLQRLLGDRYRLGLFTGSRRAVAGEVQLAVGTHALIQEGFEFRNLGLAVVDEQHRFGVLQRGLLRSKGKTPDMLVMTATPIPRSLALAAWGDLDVSTIDELPPGRTPIATEVLPIKKRREVYKRLREELNAGGRAYVVFPTIEEGSASVAELGEKVREYLSDIPSAVLHGRMPAAERERTMAAFAAGEVRVLISTTVIEVGMDVPEATWMVIESAERFGLAQLHQLRGRVGRGARPSRCLALHGKLTESGERRLKAFEETTDGFRIAEEDLAIRGPGELLGLRQAGLPGFRIARLPDDLEWLEKARDDARDLLPRLGELDLLRQSVQPKGSGEVGGL